MAIKKVEWNGLIGILMGVYTIGCGLGSNTLKMPWDWGMFITGWVMFISFAITEKNFTKKYGGEDEKI